MECEGFFFYNFLYQDRTLMHFIQKETDGRSPIHWFTQQMLTMAGARKPELSPGTWSGTLSVGPKFTHSDVGGLTSVFTARWNSCPRMKIFLLARGRVRWKSYFVISNCPHLNFPFREDFKFYNCMTPEALDVDRYLLNNNKNICA